MMIHQANSCFKAEVFAEVLGKLAHQNFVDISDFGEAVGGVPFLVMELLDGHALADELASGAVSPARALELTRQILTGLAFAHEKGIVHRDIKPENVVVVPDSERGEIAKILDLGIATTTGAKLDDVLYGTPEYMSPEQIEGQVLDGRSDLYAVGVVLYELLTGELPFSGATAQITLALQISVPPPRLAEVRPELTQPKVLQRVLDGLLAKAPDDRYPSALGAIEAVSEAMSTLGLSSVTSATWVPGLAQRSNLASPPPPRSGFWGRKLIGLAIFLAIAIAIALTLWLYRSG